MAPHRIVMFKTSFLVYGYTLLPIGYFVKHYLVFLISLPVSYLAMPSFNSLSYFLVIPTATIVWPT